MNRILITLSISLLATVAVFAQSEKLTNAEIIAMSKANLDCQIILTKIRKSEFEFDTSAQALIELKNSGVAAEVIAFMLEKSETPQRKNPTEETKTQDLRNYSENQPSLTPNPSTLSEISFVSPAESLRTAKTIALVKSSIQPSRQALEKELMKRADWKSLNLTLVRYKESADLYVEIGYVSMSWVTHRYVFRVFDRRTGTVIAAGETTSWGSLAENLARHIAKSLNGVKEK